MCTFRKFLKKGTETIKKKMNEAYREFCKTEEVSSSFASLSLKATD
jgi:hypothetical protein